MILANILVHLDSKPRTAARVALSLRIAERAGARLTGLFAEKADAHQVGTVATWPSAHYTAAMEDRAGGVRGRDRAAQRPRRLHRPQSRQRPRDHSPFHGDRARLRSHRSRPNRGRCSRARQIAG